jgi:hypothetical protein
MRNVMRMQPTPDSKRHFRGKSWPWSSVIEEFQHWLPRHAPLLDLSRVIAASDSAPKLFPGVSYDGLFITNEPEFYRDDNVLVVTYQPDERRFRLQYRMGGKISIERFCAELEILPALATILHECFEITFRYA